jgi:transposase-like protein
MAAWVYLWRAVDAEGEVLDVLVQTKRNKRAALKLMRKLLKKYGFVPDKLITDELRSYAAATGHLGIGWPAYPRAIVIRLFARKQ